MKRLGKCPVCGRCIGVNKHRIAVTHRDPNEDGLRGGCPGSGTPALPLAESGAKP